MIVPNSRCCYTKARGAVTRFTENDDVLNAISALDSNSPFFSFNKNANHSGGKILVTTSIGSGAP